jgi:hypothetical protein
MLGIRFRPALIDGIPPEGHRALEIAYRKCPCRVHERFFHTRELSRVDLACGRKDRCGRARDLTPCQSLTCPGHVLEGSRHADQLRRRGEGHAEPMRKPCRDRKVPVTPERSTPVHLGCPASKLAFHRPGRPFELSEIRLQLVVGREAQIVGTELLEDRSKGAHWQTITNTCSNNCEVRHTRAKISLREARDNAARGDQMVPPEPGAASWSASKGHRNRSSSQLVSSS